MAKPIYLYVVPFFPSRESWRGGFFFDAAKALMRDGRFDIRVMVGESGPDYVMDGLKVYRFGSFKIGDSDYFQSITDFIKLRKFIGKINEMGIKPDDVCVCHVHLLDRYAIYAQKLKKLNPRCFVMAHHHWTGLISLGYSKFTWLPFVKDLHYLRLRRSYESLDAHIFCSEATKDAYGKMYPNALIGKSFDIRMGLLFSKLYRGMKCPGPTVVYNGVDSTIFNEQDSIRNKTGEFRVGCVANFLNGKSQITLLKALTLIIKQAPAIKVIFIGTGRILHLCQTFVKDNNLSAFVEFRKEVRHQDIPCFYRSLDLYVLPSYYWEAFNCSLIEAWACGVPCMTTDVISFKEVLPREEWDKWLFPPKDEQALAQKLLWAYETRPRRQRLTRNLDIDIVTQEFLDWIDSKRKRL